MNNLDFNNIKYNLYDILNVSPHDTIQDIKKKYIKIIKVFHPDKNSELEEDIYYHLVLAGQILTNLELKEKYDKFILNKIKTHDELKHFFIKEANVIPENIKKPDFDTLNTKFNEIHGYNNFVENNNVTNIQYEKEIKIDDNYTQEINNEIIQVPSEIISYIDGEYFTYISDLDKLYINDSIQTNKFTSLDKAFISNVINCSIDESSLEQKIVNYNNLTKELNDVNYYN